MSGMWSNGGRSRPAGPDLARRAVLRPDHADAMAGTDLAVPRTAVSDDDFQRDLRGGVARDGADNPGGGVGNQRTQL